MRPVTITLSKSLVRTAKEFGMNPEDLAERILDSWDKLDVRSITISRATFRRNRERHPQA